MLSSIPVIIGALAVGGSLSGRVSAAFAGGLSRVAATVSDFFEYKAALRCLRTTRGARSRRGSLPCKAS